MYDMTQLHSLRFYIGFGTHFEPRDNNGLEANMTHEG